jgi:hypothetical protein
MRERTKRIKYNQVNNNIFLIINKSISNLIGISRIIILRRITMNKPASNNKTIASKTKSCCMLMQIKLSAQLRVCLIQTSNKIMDTLCKVTSK